MMFIQRTVAKIKDNMALRVFLLAWRGWVMPRSIRKLIAGSEIHRSWFLGKNQCFEERGVFYGLGRSYAEIMEIRRHQDVAAWREADGKEKEFAFQNCIEQWDEYCDLTDVPDLAHEIQRREDEEKKRDYKNWRKTEKIMSEEAFDVWREYNS